KVGAQPVEDGLLLQDLTAENTRINMMETVQAGKVGQGELFQKIGLTAGAIEEAGQEGEQFFNTNIMGINETVLQPFLRELEKIIGHEQYVQWTSPTFIDNPKEGGTIYQIEGALGHVLQNLDYHVRYTENQKVKDLMKKYGWTRLLHIVNFTPEYRELCFTPVKFALDWNYYLSEHFAMDTKEWAMKNNKPGHLARFEFSKNYEDYYQKNKVNAYKILPLGSKTLDLDLLYVAGKWTLNKPEYIGTVELRNDTDQEINLDELLSKAKYQHYFDKGILKRGSDGHLILDNVTIVYVGVDIDGSGTDLLVAPTQSVSSTLASIPATTGREVAAVLIKEYQADPYFISGTDQDGNIKPFITAVWHAESQQLSESEKEYYGLDFRDYYYGWSETELPVTMHAFDQNGQIFLRLSENGKMYRSYDQKSKHKRMSSSLAVIKRAAGTLNAHEAIMALRKGIPHKTWSVEWNDSSYLEHEPGFTEFFSEKNLGSGQRLIVKFWEQNRNSPLTQIMIDQYDLFLSITALRFVWNDKKQNFDAVSEDNIARKAKEIIEKMPTSSASSSVITRQQLISPITRIMQDERSDVGTMGVKLRSGGYQRVSVTNPKAPWQDLDLREPVASIRLELGNGTSYYLNVRYEGKRAIIDANKVRTTFSQTETVAARIAPILMDKRNFRLGSSRDRESYLKVVSGSQEKNWQAVDQISANFSKERAVQKIKDLSAREKAVFIDIEQHSILEKDKIDQWLSRPGKPLAYQIRFQDGSYIYLVSKDLSYRDPVVSVTPKAAEVKSVVSEKRGYWPSDSAKIQRDVEEIISIIGREEKMETIKIFNPAMLYDANKLKLKDAIDRFKEKFSMLVTQKLEGIVLTFRTYSIEISVSKSTQQIIHVHVKDKQGMRLPGFDRSKLSSENVFSTALEKKEVPAVTYIDGVPSGEPAQRTLGLERYLEEKPVVSEVSKTASAKRGFLPSGSAKIQRDVKELLSVFDRNAKLQTIEIRNFNNSFRSYNALLGAQIADAVDAFRERFGDTISTMQFEIEDFRIIVSFEEFTRKVTEVSVFDKKFREHEKAVLQRYILSAENFLSTAPEEKRAEVKSETSKPETEIPYDADIVSRKERVSFKGAKFDVQEFSKRILDATKGKLLIDTGLDFDWRKNVIFSFSSQNKMDYRAMHKPAKNVSYMIVLRQVEDEMIEIEAEFQNSAGEMNHDEGLLRLATDILKSMSQEPGVVDAPQATAPAKLSELMPGEFRHQLLEFLDQLGVRELRAVNIFDGVSFYYFYSTKQIRESREEVAHALDGLVQEKSDMQSIEILWTANRVVIDLERGEVVGVRPGFATLGAGQEDIDRIRQNLPAGHFLSMARSEPLDETPTAMSQKASDVIEDLFRDFSNTIENYLGTDEIIYSPRLGEGNFGGFNGLITIKFTKTYERFKPYWVVSFERQPDGSVEIRAKSAPVYGATPNEDLELLELAKQTIVPDLGR
ncbi:MAG TPA: hypothetical protein PLO93_02475, partial [Candidatus Omnitrophota bacterium]|nr:hypothetical protein [Candidatus Omnitrophota bacterium]